MIKLDLILDFMQFVHEKKILVTAYDLEQLEHRGIAAYSKNILRALSELGWEVWLLTSAPKSSFEQASSMIRHLAADDRLKTRIQITRSLPGFQRWRHLVPVALRQRIRSWIFGAGFSPEFIDFDAVSETRIQPRSWTGRLSYLNFITGFINVPNIFSGAITLLQRSGDDNFLVTLDLEKFNFFGVLTTCPLPIKFITGGWQAQTVHDLIPLEISSYHPWDDPKVFRARLNIAVCHSNQIIAVSKVTAEKIREIWYQAGNLSVLYQPTSLRSSPSLSARGYIAPKPYLISVGSIEPRKNILVAARAFLASNLPARGYQYFLVGDIKEGREANELRLLSKKNPSLVLLGYLSDEQRDGLLFGAECLVFPSILEGYGIPLVDAMQLQLKIICSDIPVFREVAEGNAIFVNPLDLLGWIKAFDCLDAVPRSIPNELHSFTSFKKSLEGILSTA